MRYTANLMIRIFFLSAIASSCFATQFGSPDLVQLNSQIQNQLKEMQAENQKQIDALNTQLQTQLKQMESNVQAQMQKLNTQVQAQIQQVQSALQKQILEVQAQANKVK